MKYITGPLSNDSLLLFLFLWCFFRCFLLRYRPVIQGMGDVVALTAFLELDHNAGRMRRTMAVLAIGYHLVLLLVAEGAREGLVL